MWKADATLLLAAALLIAPGAWAADCRSDRFEGLDYVICEVDASQEDLRLFHASAQTGAVLGSFSALESALETGGKKLVFAMNAGMYHADRRPVGLYIEAGKTYAHLVTQAGPGNFGMLPNGVFCIGEGRADVIETGRFSRERTDCRYATQSGPMLVIDGELHPRFLVDSDSTYIRNGVGTSADGLRAWFVISKQPVNFHSFGRLFRDHLRVPQALYFDGKISRLHAPGLRRSDIGLPMGPMVGVVIDAGKAVD